MLEAQDLRSAVSKHQPHVVLVDSGGSLKTMATLDGSVRPATLIVLRKLDDRTIAAVLAAGAADIIGASAGVEELVHRVEVAARIAAAAPLPSEGILGNSSASVRARGLLEDRIAVALDATDVMSCRVEACEPALAARVRMTCPEDSSTLDLFVGLDRSDAETLLQRLAPGADPTDAFLRDCVGELANLAAGGIKEASIHEGIEATLSLPRQVEPSGFVESAKIWAVEAVGLRIYFGVVTGPGRKSSVPVRGLVPGMVLQHDVLNAAGVAFVRSGVALSERTIERLQDVLGTEFLVDIAEGTAAAA